MNKIGIIYILISFLLIATTLLIQETSEKQELKVSCYDKHNNPINDVTCNETKYKSSFIEFLQNLLPIAIIILFFFGLMELMLDAALKKDSDYTEGEKDD